MHLKKDSLFFGWGVECGFLVINKNPDVSPLTATPLPISSSLVHLVCGATSFFCSMFVSAQTLDSRTPGKCFYSFLLLVVHLPPLHPLSSLSLDCHGSGFKLSLFFLGINLYRTGPCYSARLLLFSSFRFLLCLNSRITLPSQGHVWDFII